MQRCILLHSNDLHGHVDALARIATLVKQIRTENPAIPILYLDAGDIEESVNRISNLTRGIGMHRLLSVAGCQAATIGNGGVLRYGFEVLADYHAIARYPLLMANIRQSDGSLPQGVQSTAILQAGTVKLGLIGITDNLFHAYTDRFGMFELPTLPLVQELASQLRKLGADTVILLSHMGLTRDRQLAVDLQEEVPLIIGAHSHDLLLDGERVGKVMVAQAGSFGHYLGQLDICWDGEQLHVERASVRAVSSEIVPDPAILAEIEKIEEEIAPYLNTIVGELAEPLEISSDRECKAANILADALRARMRADVGLAVAACAGPLKSGSLRRETLLEAFHLARKPCVTSMTGAQLRLVITRGQDRAFAATGSRALRCDKRGLLHLSGASIRSGQIFVGEHPLEEERIYRVAGGDQEISHYGGYVEKAWNLSISYETATTLSDAMEAYLAESGPLRVSVGRLGSQSQGKTALCPFD
ncbi:MAG TPA: bifunctional UDP-sugar hydrolase/5'-nucleotidase [Ktedonobacteraceae bacterium]|jgi:2',3'-cyclic-nucleotide 2'-phosphodiesterase (5'-nucleotidase family)|nr:bifunctional UDP-sugar hydrolase/5'-nucleotidase [Ktedonobacteraceae bacterium]